jgi:hypothetical protein
MTKILIVAAIALAIPSVRHDRSDPSSGLRVDRILKLSIVSLTECLLGFVTSPGSADAGRSAASAAAGYRPLCYALIAVGSAS